MPVYAQAARKFDSSPGRFAEVPPFINNSYTYQGVTEIRKNDETPEAITSRDEKFRDPALFTLQPTFG